MLTVITELPLDIEYVQVNVFCGFPGGSDSKESTCDVGYLVQSLDWEDPLEKEMATHPRILAWEIPCTEEPGGLQFLGLQKNWMCLSD